MQLDVVDMQGKKVGAARAGRRRLRRRIKEHLFWEVVKAQLAAQAPAGTHATKTAASSCAAAARSPTSRRAPATPARVRAALRTSSVAAWCSGPQPRDYEYTVPKKVRRAALRLGALAAGQGEQGRRRRPSWPSTRPRPRRWSSVLKALGVGNGPGGRRARTTARSTKSVRNLASAKCLAPEGLNVYDILHYPALVITSEAVKAVESRILGDGGRAASPQGSEGRLKGQVMRSPEQIIKRPLLTEKGTAPQGDRRRDQTRCRGAMPSRCPRRSLFEVARDANKIEIRHAVEKLFKVNVAEGQDAPSCAARRSAWAGSWAGARTGRRRSSRWRPGRTSSSSKGA